MREDNQEIEEISAETVLTDVKQLNNCNEEDSMKIFQKLLPLLSRTIHESEIWQAILNNLLKFITHKNSYEQQQLCARIYLSIFQKIYTATKLEALIKKVLLAKVRRFFIHNEQFRINDLDVFKLMMMNGYLLMEKDYSPEINREILTILKKNCSSYTKYTLFSFESLKSWLLYLESNDHWKNDSSNEYFPTIDALIFSNWDNCLPGVSNIITNSIFPIFLRIMERKYPEFINNIHEGIMKQLSWKNPLKYIILTKSWGSEREKVLQETAVIREVLKSLENDSLIKTSTNLYFSYWGAFQEDRWLQLYTKEFHETLKKWEEVNSEALGRFWRLWMTPTLKKFSRAAFIKLWQLFFNDKMIVSQSYLIKLATENQMNLMEFFESTNEEEEIDFFSHKNVWMKNSITGIPTIFHDSRESVKINTFFVYCSGAQFKTHEEYEKLIIYSNDERLRELIQDNTDYDICKWFFYYNARTLSPKMLQIICDYFEILLERIEDLKDEKTKDFSQWLYEFILNCFEFGSCEERKLFGLNLFRIILSFIKKNPNNLLWNNENWSCNNKLMFHLLGRLCLDPTEEIRSKSCELIINYFKKTQLTKDEIQSLSSEATKNCLSSKFWIISGGVNLWRIISLKTVENCPKILLEESRKQLLSIKVDIEAVTKGASFYVTLMIFNSITFASKNVQTLEKSFYEGLSALLEEATNFFLLTSSLDSESSLSRVPVRVKAALKRAYIKNSLIDDSEMKELSPIHQTIVSSMWTSLKLISELSGKLVLLECPGKRVRRRLIDIIVKILKRTRHRDVIEAAGSVLMRLMDVKPFNNNYFTILDELFISTEGEINWLKNGKKEVFLLHQFLHWNEEIIGALIDSIIERILNFLRMSQYEKDASKANGSTESSLKCQLSYLESIIEEESLHPYYAHSLEEIALFCLHCFRFTDSSIKEPSISLFSTIIPRISGESRDGELDFGIGYSLDHFCPHFPTLALAILKALRDEVTEHIKSELINDCDGSIEPILQLLSRISINYCFFFEYHYAEFRREITHELLLLLSHPVGRTRELAAKAYAALTLPQCIGKLLLLEKTTDYDENYEKFNHGSYSLQVYLQKRAEYESICSHEKHAESIKKGTIHQIKRFERIIHDWINGECEINYKAETMFLKSLLTSPELMNCEELSAITCWSLLTHPEIENRIKNDGKAPGFWEFMVKFVEINCFFIDFDEVSSEVISILSEFNRYSVCVMKNLRISREFQQEEAEENIKKYFDGQLPLDSDVYDRISSRIERGEVVHNICYEIYEAVRNEDENIMTYLKEIVGFVIEIIRKGAFISGVQGYDSRFGVYNLITWLINSRDHKKLGCEMIIGIGDHFDNYGYQRRAVEFVANKIRYGDEEERIWGMNWLGIYLRDKKFVSIDNTMQMRIIEGLVALLNDEIRGIRDNFIGKFESFEVKPRVFGDFMEIRENGENYFHELLRIGIHSQAVSQDEIYREWIHDVINSVTSDIESENYRENGKIVNILTHLIRQAQSSLCSYPNVLYERLNLTKIVRIGNCYQEDYIDKFMKKESTNYSIILRIKMSDYLADKKRILHNIIEKRKRKCV